MEKLEKGSAMTEGNFAETEAWYQAERRRTAAVAMGRIPQFKICYLLPHTPQDLRKASAFGWYTPGILKAAWALARAATLPADVREGYSSPQHQLLFRLNRSIWPTIIPLEIDALEIVPTIATPFIVFLTVEREAANIVDSLRAKLSLPTLHSSMIAGAGRTSLSGLTVEELYRYVRAVVAKLAARPESAAVAKAIRQVMSEAAQRRGRRHSLRMGDHNVTTPNEIALTAFGWKITHQSKQRQELRPVNAPQVYIDGIIRSADAVTAFREELLRDVHPCLRDNRYVLAVPSVYWGQHRRISERAAQLPESLRRTAKKILREIISPTTYYGTFQRGEFEPEAAELFLTIQGERAADLKSFTASLSCMAAASLVPVLRLEPKVGNVKKEINALCHTVRISNGPHRHWKASRLGRALGERMRGLIAPEFLDRIDAPEADGYVEGIKLVCDAPLELLSTRGIALSLRFDASRISPIPGNMSHMLCTAPPTFLGLSAFSQVLVIRSFAESDPVRLIFENAIDSVLEGLVNHPTYRFVDVASDTDIVAALSSFNGAIVIFDCHGTVDQLTGGGTLLIGGKPSDIWSLRSRCTLPPIVMFSACDTQPMDGSHSSVATAAFNLGARAVLATSMPINALSAAQFNARMLVRLTSYLPAAINARPLTTWREVTSGLLRMMYVTEAMMQLKKFAGYLLTKEKMMAIQYETTNAISNRRADWHDTFVRFLSGAVLISSEVVREDLGRWCSFLDTHKYVQLGNPENIVITSEAQEANSTLFVESQ